MKKSDLRPCADDGLWEDGQGLRAGGADEVRGFKGREPRVEVTTWGIGSGRQQVRRFAE